MVVEGIRNNAPYILTHAEFRNEVRELWEMMDAAFPRDQVVPPERAAFEENRRDGEAAALTAGQGLIATQDSAGAVAMDTRSSNSASGAVMCGEWLASISRTSHPSRRARSAKGLKVSSGVVRLQ
jgi:hypothetical protein